MARTVSTSRRYVSNEGDCPLRWLWEAVVKVGRMT